MISTPRAVFTPLWSQKLLGISPSNEVRIKLKQILAQIKEGYRTVRTNHVEGHRFQYLSFKREMNYIKVSDLSSRASMKA